MWIIEDFEKSTIEAKEHGLFFSGESYIVLYRYKKNVKDCAVIYFWQG